MKAFFYVGAAASKILAIIACLVGISIPAFADTIFDSMPGDFYGTLNPISFDDDDVPMLAGLFSVSGSYIVDSIEVPLLGKEGIIVDDGEARLSVYTNSGGPDTQIFVGSTQPLSLEWDVYTFSVGSLLLTPNYYWAVLDSDGTAGGSWGSRLSGDFSIAYEYTTPGGWGIVNYPPALRVNGTLVPEPATIFLFGTGLGVLGLAAYRRRKK